MFLKFRAAINHKFERDVFFQVFWLWRDHYSWTCQPVILILFLFHFFDGIARLTTRNHFMALRLWMSLGGEFQTITFNPS